MTQHFSALFAFRLPLNEHESLVGIFHCRYCRCTNNGYLHCPCSVLIVQGQLSAYNMNSNRSSNTAWESGLMVGRTQS